MTDQPIGLLDTTDKDPGKWYAADDVKGGSLPPKLVLDARKKELAYLLDMHVYHPVPRQQAIQAGKRPLKLKWIDTNKGDRANPLVRSRLVCTEVRRKGMEAVFAPTPPLDSLKALLVKGASRYGRTGSDLTVQLIDVSRAHFYAHAILDV